MTTRPLTAVAVVQARMGSTRFPGKSLAEVEDWTVLGLLLARLTEARELDEVVVATSGRASDDAIEVAAAIAGFPTVRGPRDDVLTRYTLAAASHPSDLVVRICADNPLTDPLQVDALVQFARDGGYDLAHNNVAECGLPDGVGAEVMTADALRRLDNQAISLPHREHVTLFAYDNPDAFRLGRLDTTDDQVSSPWRLDVDYPEDLEFIRALYRLLPEGRAPFWSTAEIVAVLEEHPDLARLRRQGAAAGVRN